MFGYNICTMPLILLVTFKKEDITYNERKTLNFQVFKVDTVKMFPLLIKA